LKTVLFHISIDNLSHLKINYLNKHFLYKRDFSYKYEFIEGCEVSSFKRFIFLMKEVFIDYFSLCFPLIFFHKHLSKLEGYFVGGYPILKGCLKWCHG
jgi:hypothetical protein